MGIRRAGRAVHAPAAVATATTTRRRRMPTTHTAGVAAIAAAATRAMLADAATPPAAGLGRLFACVVKVVLAGHQRRRRRRLRRRRGLGREVEVRGGGNDGVGQRVPVAAAAALARGRARALLIAAAATAATAAVAAARESARGRLERLACGERRLYLPAFAALAPGGGLLLRERRCARWQQPFLRGGRLERIWSRRLALRCWLCLGHGRRRRFLCAWLGCRFLRLRLGLRLLCVRLGLGFLGRPEQRVGAHGLEQRRVEQRVAAAAAGGGGGRRRVGGIQLRLALLADAPDKLEGLDRVDGDGGDAPLLLLLPHE